jgi:quercetin dioxygenase-like cupin family protein
LRVVVLGLSLLVVVATAAIAAVAGGAMPGIRFSPDQIPWRAAPPSMPPHTELAVLEGDPAKEGIVTMRLRLKAGFRLPLHTHPVDERVTVLSGAVRVGFPAGVVDDQARAAAGRWPAGSFYVNPPGVPHFVEADEDTVLQITVQGPWRVDLVAPPPPPPPSSPTAGP